MLSKSKERPAKGGRECRDPQWPPVFSPPVVWTGESCPLEASDSGSEWSGETQKAGVLVYLGQMGITGTDETWPKTTFGP